MSKISTFYDDLNTELNTLYGSTHRKIANPYDLDGPANDKFTLNRGYGFFIGPGRNTERLASCQLTIGRDVVIKLTIVHRGTDKDVTIRETAEKRLLEDQFLLIDALEKSPTLVAGLVKMVFSSDNGIEFDFGDRSNYLTIESTFTIEYFEDLT